MNNINTSFKKIYFLLILVFSFFLTSVNTTYSEEKIGSIVTLKEEVFAINADGEKRLLDLYDEIFLQDEILTNELSSATVQYNDNSTIIIKKSSSFKVTDFNITGLKNIFLGEVQKGSVIIESGEIAKEDNGSMVIELPNMTLGIKGTRFIIENNPDGTSEVSLAEDSFGNVGTINIASAGKLKTLFDTKQVVSANTETGFSERAKTDVEKKELVDASNDLIEASSVDENIIQKNLEEKLLNGSLLDANGDGKIDTLDVEVIKEGIKLEKQGKIDFIVSNSSFGNTDFLSNVLNNSDEISTGQSMNKIFETKNDIVVSVMKNLSNGNNRFITTSEFEVNNIIKEKIYNQMLENNNNENNNINIIANIMSKSDVDTIEKLVGYVEVLDVNSAGSNFSLQVLSSLADVRTQNNVIFEDEKQAQVNRLIEEAVANAGNNDSGSMMLANVMTKSDVGTIGIMVDNIQMKGQSDPNSNFSLQVLSSVADSNFENNTSFETAEQTQVNRLIEEAVANAGNNDSGSMMLANVMTKSDVGTIGIMVDNIQMKGQSDPNSNFSLQVLSSVADMSSQNLVTFETEEQNQVNRLIEEAVASVANSDEGIKLLANVFTNSDVETISLMVDSIQDFDKQNPFQNQGNNTDTSLSLQILSSVADSNFENNTSFETAEQTQVNRLIEEAVASVANSDEGIKLLANVITKSDTSTVGSMLDSIATVSVNDPFSTLAAEVLSEIATTTANTDTYFDEATMNQFSDLVDTVAYTDTATDDAAALALTTATLADDDAAAATTATGTTTTDDTLYDAAGFAFAPPYYHKDTGTIYNNAGFDKDGNSSTVGSGDSDVTYDAAGFSMDPPYYHKDTNTMYNNDGFDKDGNSSGAAGEDFDENGFSTVTPFNHNVTDTQFDSDGLHRTTRTTRDDDGYNSAGYNVDGFNRADQWNASYDENDDVSGA